MALTDFSRIPPDAGEAGGGAGAGARAGGGAAALAAAAADVVERTRKERLRAAAAKYSEAISEETRDSSCSSTSASTSTSISSSSNHSSSSGGYVNFSAGVKEIFISSTASQMISGVWLDALGSLFSTSNSIYLGVDVGKNTTYNIIAQIQNIMIGNSTFSSIGNNGSGCSRNVGIGQNVFNAIQSDPLVPGGVSNNVGIGHAAGVNLLTGSNNVCIGSVANTTASLGSTDNCIVIGANTTGNGSNTTTIGHTTITDCYIRGHLHPSGAVRPASIADASAPTNALYYSTDANKLVYKDASGTVNNLY